MSRVLDYFAGLDLFGWLEIIAMFVGIYYVYLEIRKTRLLWYVCILTSILNIFVYWHNNYLSMALIQVYYIVMAFYGIHAFKEIKEEAIEEYGAERNPTGQKVAIRRFDWKTGAVTLAIAVAAFFVLAPMLKVYATTHGTLLFPSQPYWDAFIAVGSMVGTFFLSKSYMCQWYIWIVLDLITVGVFLYSGMYWMSVMYVCYIIMSLIGIRNWRINGVYVD
ncbi:MAG: nicotinamide mononucleotide transporter [Bacteroidales bacterium]|nr:nicotinamide mononucleotide transporter [Bacteroidales bacterium]